MPWQKPVRTTAQADALDTGKSGFLDEAEFTGPFNENLAFATAAYASGLMTGNMFMKVDVNGDGKVSLSRHLAKHVPWVLGTRRRGAQ